MKTALTASIKYGLRIISFYVHFIYYHHLMSHSRVCISISRPSLARYAFLHQHILFCHHQICIDQLNLFYHTQNDYTVWLTTALDPPLKPPPSTYSLLRKQIQLSLQKQLFLYLPHMYKSLSILIIIDAELHWLAFLSLRVECVFFLILSSTSKLQTASPSP